MKKLIPVILALIALMATTAFVGAQTKIHNPHLERGLVFQWKIVADQVHPTWLNSDFTISRSQGQLMILYGMYNTLAEAMTHMPKMPSGVSVQSVSLVPFFNQMSISAADAFALMGNRNWYDLTGKEMEQSVSFTVYFDTFLSPKSKYALEEIDEPLSFEILGNHAFAYSAGEFGSLEEAEQYRNRLLDLGYANAEVNRFLNGQKVAFSDLEEIYAYVQFGF